MAARKGGRPKGAVKKVKPLTVEQQVSLLCSAWCPTEDIAEELGIARSTFYERFSDAIKTGHARGRNRLRLIQLQIAESIGPGAATMAIWLGKQYLGQTDKLPEFAKLTDDELLRYAGLVTSSAAGPAGVGAPADGAAGDPEANGGGVN